MRDKLCLCLLSSHATLLVFWLVSATTSSILYIMMFASGIGTILLFSSSAYIYHDVRAFITTIAVGATTFLTSTSIAEWVPFFAAVFKWSISVAFTLGTLNSMRLVDAKVIVTRNVIYHTLTLVLNLVYALIMQSF